MFKVGDLVTFKGVSTLFNGKKGYIESINGAYHNVKPYGYSHIIEVYPCEMELVDIKKELENIRDKVNNEGDLEYFLTCYANIDNWYKCNHKLLVAAENILHAYNEYYAIWDELCERHKVEKI